jgi:hypothetical protein
MKGFLEAYANRSGVACQRNRWEAMMGKRRARPAVFFIMLGMLLISVGSICPWGLRESDSILSGLGPSISLAQDKIQDKGLRNLKAEPLYRAVRLTWMSTLEGKGPLTFEVLRSQAKPEGPYSVVVTLEGKTGTHKHECVDKNLPVEENYFYKIRIQQTGEELGPVQVRPPFSLPTT